MPRMIPIARIRGTPSHCVGRLVSIAWTAFPGPIPRSTDNWAYFNMPPFAADPDAALLYLMAHYIDIGCPQLVRERDFTPEEKAFFQAQQAE